MNSNKSLLKELKKSDKRAKWWKRQRWVLSPGTENKWEKKTSEIEKKEKDDSVAAKEVPDGGD